MRKFVLFMLVIATFAGCQKDQLPQKEKEPKVEFEKYTPPAPREKVPVKKTYYSIITLQIEQSFWLNSATYLGSNKRTRVSIPINLPDDTVGLYYVVTAADSKRDEVQINLAGQLKNILKDYNKEKLIDIASKIKLPKLKTSSEVDVFLLDAGQNNNFLSKADFSYYPSGSRSGFANTVFEVLDFSNLSLEEWIKNPYFNRRYFIGFRNPQTFDGEKINVEVVAVIKNERTVYEYR